MATFVYKEQTTSKRAQLQGVAGAPVSWAEEVGILQEWGGGEGEGEGEGTEH